LHGTEDKIISYDASRSFFEQIPVTDKVFISIDGGFHELQHDIKSDRNTYFNELINWLKKRSDTSSIITTKSTAKL